MALLGAVCVRATRVYRYARLCAQWESRLCAQWESPMLCPLAEARVFIVGCGWSLPSLSTTGSAALAHHVAHLLRARGVAARGERQSMCGAQTGSREQQVRWHAPRDGTHT